MKKPPRGERNNNPGNIRDTKIEWQGEIEGMDKEFETFSTPVLGIRAIAVVILNYYRRYRINTIRGLINRWAPPVENDTDSYVKAVAKECGMDPDVTIPNVKNIKFLVNIVRAIIRHENGRVIYPDDMITEAVTRAL